MLNRVTLSEQIMFKLSGADKNALMSRYDNLAESLIKKDGKFKDNAESYAQLLNSTVFLTMMLSENYKIANYKNLADMLTPASSYAPSLQLKSYKELYEKLVTAITSLGISIPEITTMQNIILVLNTFDVEAVDEQGEEELSEEELDDIFKEVFQDDDVGNTAPGEEYEVDEDDTAEEEDDEAEEPEDESREKAIESLKANAAINGFVGKNVKEIVNVLDALYRSGFEGMPSIGIMLDPGMDSRIVHIDKAAYTVKPLQSEDTMYELSIFDSLTKLLPSVTSIAKTTETEKCVPSTEYFSTGVEAICPNMHLAFQTANIQFTTGMISIRKWITKQAKKENITSKEWLNKYNNGQTVALGNFKHIRKWYEWAVETIIYNAFVDLNLKSLTERPQMADIINKISNAIINIVAVSEKKVGVETVLKVATLKNVDREELKKSIESSINIGGFSSIEVKSPESDEYIRENHVFSLRVIYDKEAEKKSTIFAADVLDNLIAGGNPPSWGNALLGKSTDGAYLYWKDFMDPGQAQAYKRCYTIYAGTRSGKGVMTSTLVASALCDRKQVFYTDGKPENGACIGRLAWRDGKEAYVFDGRDTGAVPFTGPMENYSFDVRKSDEIVEYIDRLPKKLFENKKYFDNAQQKKYLGLMRYLKSMMLCASVIKARSISTLDQNNWQIWFFDEAQNMCKTESRIRNIFKNYVTDTLKIKEFSYKTATAKMAEYITPGNEKYDEGIEYIYKWINWTEEIYTLIYGAVTIDLGKAGMNVIFIFQGADWINDLSSASENCTIARVIKTLDSTKIVGNGAIKNGCGDYGQANTKEESWYKDYVSTGRGWWAISEKADLRQSEVKLFKPYSIWTIPLTPDLQKLRDESEVQGMSRREKTLYFEGYVDELLGAYGVQASDILQDSYNYADNAVKTLGYASELKEFIYDCSNFAVDNTDNSYEALKEELRNAGETEEDESADGFKIDLGKHDDEEGYDVETEEFEDDAEIDFGIDDEETVEETEEETNTDEATGLVELTPTSELMDTVRYRDSSLIDYLNRVINPLISNIAQFDIQNRDTKTKKGLKQFAVMLSNIHYIAFIRKVVSSDVYLNFFTQMAGEDRVDGTSVRAKIALAMLREYDSSELAYDTMPDKGRLLMYIKTADRPKSYDPETPFDFSTLNEADIDLNEDGTVDFGESATPDEKMELKKPFFDFDKNGQTIINPRDSQTIIIPLNDEFQEAKEPKYSILRKWGAKLFESRNGTSYAFKKRWDYVLEAIEDKFPQKSMVTRVAISGGSMAVNGKQIILDNVLGGPYDVRIEDIINIKALFKKFKMIQSLTLDSEATQCMITQYGPDIKGIVTMFTENRSLKSLGIIPAGMNKPVVYNRQTLMAEQEKLKQQLEIEQTKMKVEHFAASKNPKLSRKSPGYTSRFFNGSKGLSASLFKGAGNAIKDKNPKLVKAAAYSVVGTAIITVGGAVGLIGLAGKGIGKLFRLFKR